MKLSDYGTKSALALQEFRTFLKSKCISFTLQINFVISYEQLESLLLALTLALG